LCRGRVPSDQQTEGNAAVHPTPTTADCPQTLQIFALGGLFSAGLLNAAYFIAFVLV
jgi:hypothetical protein